MGSRRNHAQKKRREKHKRKREQAKRRAKARAKHGELPRKQAKLINLACEGEFGPAWVSEDYARDPRSLVRVILTRALPRGRLLACEAVVDRGCFGVKRATLLDSTSEAGVRAWVAELAEQGRALVSVDSVDARSLVFHALDYARELGVEIQPSSELRLFSPRPEPLASIPGVHPERPVFQPEVADHEDPRTRRLLWRLVARFGPEGVELAGPLAPLVYGDQLEALVADPDRALDPADAGGDAERIDWRAACEGVPSYEMHDRDALDLGEIVEDADAFRKALGSGVLHTWEAVLREEQGLALSAEQRERLAGLPREDGRVLFLDDDWPRPRAPWYDSYRALTRHLLLPADLDEEIYPEDMALGMDLVDCVRDHGAGLSLPSGLESTDELLPPELVRRLKLQAALASTMWLGKSELSLALSSVEGIIEQLCRELEHVEGELEAQGWSVGELLDTVSIPEPERGELLAALRERGVEL